MFPLCKPIFSTLGRCRRRRRKFLRSSGVRVYRIDPLVVLTVFRRQWHSGYGGDGGPATGASLSNPKGLALDGQGQPVHLPTRRTIDPKVAQVRNNHHRWPRWYKFFGKAMADSQPAPGFWGPQGVAVDALGISTSPTPWTLGYERSPWRTESLRRSRARATVLPAEMAGRL